MSDQRDMGRVKWFKTEKGFGFIERDKGQDLFFHKSQIEDVVQAGDQVSFRVVDGKKGQIATEIKKVA